MAKGSNAKQAKRRTQGGYRDALKQGKAYTSKRHPARHKRRVPNANGPPRPARAEQSDEALLKHAWREACRELGKHRAGALYERELSGTLPNHRP